MAFVHTLIAVLVAVTLAEMMFAMGLRLNFGQSPEGQIISRGLIFKALLGNYLVVPGITVFAIFLFNVDPAMAIGLLILGVSPAAPYGLPFTILARGNLVISTALMVILASSSALLAPIMLYFLLPVVIPGDLSLVVDPVKLAGNLFVIQLIPLGLGLAFRQWKPAMATRILKPAAQLSKVLNFVMILTLAWLQFKVILNIQFISILMMLFLVCTGIITGWLLGYPEKENQVSLSIITSMRNFSLAIGIAATAFPGSPVMTGILAYSFVAGTGVLIFALLLRFTTKKKTMQA